MEFNNKRLEKTSKLINYIIAIVLCGFLISLSGKLIDDVDQWEERPTVEQFENKELIEANQVEVDSLEEKIRLKRDKIESIESTIQVARSNYNDAKNSYDNWLAARKTVGSPKEDKEVRLRVKELDKFYITKQEWEKEKAGVEKEITILNKKAYVFIDIIDTERDKAYELQDAAIRKYDLKVFLIRLLFILPILLLGIFFIVKFRKNKYWPLFLGFVLFSFYAFFFGLVPYLPSYGGYIRYTVGIILSILFGIYFINKIKAFIERKKAELKESTSERAQKVRAETAEKALDNHMCPSCGKDFIVKQWDKSSGKKSKAEGFGFVTNFCRFCGLELFKKCDTCGTDNFAHLPYCSNCGDEVTKK